MIDRGYGLLRLESSAFWRGRPVDLVANRALSFVILTGFGVATYALTVAVLGPVVPFTGAAARAQALWS